MVENSSSRGFLDTGGWDTEEGASREGSKSLD